MIKEIILCKALRRLTYKKHWMHVNCYFLEYSLKVQIASTFIFWSEKITLENNLGVNPSSVTLEIS